jgi:uncharacterized membrane protein (UPF0127 family)
MRHQSAHHARHRSLSTLLLAAALLTACAGDTQHATPPADEPAAEAIPFRRDGTLDFVRDGEAYLTIDIEIADSDSSIVRGLMQRAALPDRSGMLFLMPNEERQSFWMANIPLALDILFANEAHEIVRVAKYTRPLSQENVTSNAPARYVIEVVAGFSDTYGILEGDEVRWTRGDEVSASM